MFSKIAALRKIEAQPVPEKPGVALLRELERENRAVTFKLPVGDKTLLVAVLLDEAGNVIFVPSFTQQRQLVSFLLAVRDSRCAREIGFLNPLIAKAIGNRIESFSTGPLSKIHEASAFWSGCALSKFSSYPHVISLTALPIDDTDLHHSHWLTHPRMTRDESGANSINYSMVVIGTEM